MRIWFTSFVLLFLTTEFFQWVRHFTVPLPVFILGGVLLAIASNSSKRAGFPFKSLGSTSAKSSIAGAKSPVGATFSPTSPAVSLPQSQPSVRSISFTIPKPEQPDSFS